MQRVAVAAEHTMQRHAHSEKGVVGVDECRIFDRGAGDRRGQRRGAECFDVAQTAP